MQLFQTCPEWNPWSEWSPCTKSCGGGERARARDCVLPSYGRGSNELGCLGEGVEREQCSTEVCPVWTEWGDWTPCTVSCGGGLQVLPGLAVINAIKLQAVTTVCLRCEPGSVFFLWRGSLAAKGRRRSRGSAVQTSVPFGPSGRIGPSAAPPAVEVPGPR